MGLNSQLPRSSVAYSTSHPPLSPLPSAAASQASLQFSVFKLHSSAYTQTQISSLQPAWKIDLLG